MRRFITLLLIIGLPALFAACGGGEGSGGHNQQFGSGGSTPLPTPTGDNVHPIYVDGGPAGLNIPNLAYTTITICVPGTTQCQTIDHVIVDTGSTGLRVLASAVSSLSLPYESLAGHTLAECVPFLDGSYMWGPIHSADIIIGDKIAAATRIQVVADSNYGSPPDTCLNNSNSSATPQEIDGIETLGGNAILGVSQFHEDCGDYCSNPQNDYYYDCSTASSCVETIATADRQVQNPIPQFVNDNNGVIIQLPSVASSGTTSVDGWMIFGINTRDNNALGSATIFTLDDAGNLTTIYKGSEQTASFIDSGSNAFYFIDDAIPGCDNLDPFFCPTSTLRLSATLRGQNNNSTTVNFRVGNTEAMNGNYFALPSLAAFYYGDFDWGLPFFYGRKVYTALESNPEGPYVAF